MRNSLINYWLNDFDRNFFSRPGRFNTPMASQDEAQFNFAPRADVIENDREYLFQFDLPGVSKEDVKISLNGSELSVTGARKSELKTETKKWHREERVFGKFERIFVLPETADTEAVNAEFKDGVLTVSVAKKELSQPKVIQIKSH